MINKTVVMKILMTDLLLIENNIDKSLITIKHYNDLWNIKDELKNNLK